MEIVPDWTPDGMQLPPAAAATRPARSAWLPLTSSFCSAKHETICKIMVNHSTSDNFAIRATEPTIVVCGIEATIAAAKIT